MKYKEKY